MFVCGIQVGLLTDLFLMSVYICGLFGLYNLLLSPYGKAFVYKKALEVAAAEKAAEYIIPSFKNIDSFVSEWGIGNLEQRELYLAITLFRLLPLSCFSLFSLPEQPKSAGL